ncbi:MAG: hypothetical protein JNM94_11280 [Phycisphaerae bacterium]|nr:hypothetical protein [Phycisphaerae bacterium]
MPRSSSVAGPVRWMLVVAMAFVAAWFVPEAAAQVRPPKPRSAAKKEPTPKEFKPKRAVERVIEVDVIEFDPYWRDGCLLLADSLQPLADLVKNPTGDTSVDGEKRRAAAAPIAKEVDALRRNANAARKIRVLWLPISESECRPVFVPAEIGLDIDAGESYDIATAKVLGGAGFATRLRPKPDPSVATEADVRAAAERIRGTFAPVDIEACTTITRIKKDTNSGARQANRERFDRALALPPEWNEGPDAIRSLKASAELSDAPATGSAPAREVTVRVEAPKYVNAVTRVGFDLYEKTKDGGRGAKVNAKEPLVAWGYAGRAALCQVPVKAPCEFGYEVEIVSAKYR